jgi:hypothetical protein
VEPLISLVFTAALSVGAVIAVLAAVMQYLHKENMDAQMQRLSASLWAVFLVALLVFIIAGCMLPIGSYLWNHLI